MITLPKTEITLTHIQPSAKTSPKRASEPPIPHAQKITTHASISTSTTSHQHRHRHQPQRHDNEREKQQQLAAAYRRRCSCPVNMAPQNKIAPNSPSRQSPSELETSLANALTDLETNTQDLKASLRPLQFVSAREVRIMMFSFNEVLEVGAMCVGILRSKGVDCVCDGELRRRITNGDGNVVSGFIWGFMC